MKKLITMSSVLILFLMTLSACGREEPVKSPDQEAIKKYKHELVYYEILNNGDEDYPKVDIAYKQKGKLKHMYTNLDYVYEHIIEDDSAPFFVKDGKKVHVYRPPYMTFGGDHVEGEIVEKSELSDGQ
ncbi:hypothetical protein MUA48_04715 [Staphylococcus sp. IVB6238]|uniref:hypothetical protein n=1 Tax=Staphylococcus sp. IVB6238 TaxID=2989770 RepID=UPI0021CED2A2|nr:hypothetical protein [Staphylococcus sp. IVB6238]UXR74753.1 hypothetical protein MUA48_04715 [Staphylococcus sp. IVB6238]